MVNPHQTTTIATMAHTTVACSCGWTEQFPDHHAAIQAMADHDWAMLLHEREKELGIAQ